MATLPAFEDTEEYTEETPQDSLPSFEDTISVDTVEKPAQAKTTATPEVQTTRPPTQRTSPPVRTAAPTLVNGPYQTPGADRWAVTDKQAEGMDAVQQSLIYESTQGKGTVRQRAERIYAAHPELFAGGDKKKTIGELEYGIRYYRSEHNKGKAQWYVPEGQLPAPITVTADKSKLKTPSTSIVGGVLDTVSDASNAVLEGTEKAVSQPLVKLADNLGKLLGTIDPNNTDVEEAIYQVSNQDEASYASPDSLTRTLGNLAGETAPYVLLSGLRPVTALAPSGGALTAAGDLAIQGGIIGAAQSDGEDVIGDSLKNAFLTAVFAGLPAEGAGSLRRARGEEGYGPPKGVDVSFSKSSVDETGQPVREFEITSPEAPPVKGRVNKDGTVAIQEAPDAGLKRLLGKEDAPPISPDPVAGDDVVARLTEALKTADKVRPEQLEMFKKARAEKFAKASEAQYPGSGREAYEDSLKALKGKLPSPDFEDVGRHFSEKDIHALFDVVSGTGNLTTTGKLSAYSGLEKVLKGEIPAPKELEHLSKAFPTDFVKEIVSKRSMVSKQAGVFGEIWNLPKSLMSTADLSAPLRQGLGLIHRKEFGGAATEMIKYATDPKHFDELIDYIESHPNYALAEEAKLSLTTNKQFGVREDVFSSHLGDKVPVWGKVVQGSERGYVGFLNKLRFDTFNSLIQQADNAGLNLRDNPKALRAVADYINIMTGRGGLGALEGAVRELNMVFFSPGLISSRLQILTAPLGAPFGLGFIAKLPKELRAEAVKSYGGMVGYYTTIVGLASAAGYQISSDPFSSDFGKIKDGDTRVDLGGGLLQYITAGARALWRKSTSTTSGNTRDLKRKGDTPLDADIKFILNKLHPSLSLLVDQQRGTDAVGKPFSWELALASRLSPMGLPDIYETIKEHPNQNGVMYSILGLLGAGLQNYPSKPNKTEETALPDTEDTVPLDSKPTTEVKTKEGTPDDPSGDSDLPDYDSTSPVSETTESNLVATKVVKGLGLHITDDGIRSEQRQAEYFRTTKGAAKPGSSSHGIGNAIDIRVPRNGVTPSQIKTNLEKNGFFGITYITKPHGTGPHWHFQWKGRKQQ